jgi:Pectate lyase superfamily protein
VPDHGAAGDGKTYDDDAFERAINAVAALSTASRPFGDPLGDYVRMTNLVGPILFIPRGTYRLSRTLDLVRQVILQGEGGTDISEGNSILFFDGPGEAPGGPGTPVTGIAVHVPRTVPGFKVDVPAGRADGSVISDLAILGNNPSTSVPARGATPTRQSAREWRRGPHQSASSATACSCG